MTTRQAPTGTVIAIPVTSSENASGEKASTDSGEASIGETTSEESNSTPTDTSEGNENS